jgi:hypothetical protein
MTEGETRDPDVQGSTKDYYRDKNMAITDWSLYTSPRVREEGNTGAKQPFSATDNQKECQV